MLARAGRSKISRKSFLNRSRKLPGTSRSSLWPSWGSFCPSWGSFGASWGSFWSSFGPPGTLLGFSLGALGSLWGASWASKSLPNRSRRLSRKPPAPELDFGSILGPILAPFWDPPDLKKQGFRVEGVSFFEKSRGSDKHPKNGNLAIVEREARSKRELQARQERQEQRGQQEQGEPERQYHEKQHRKSGKTSESASG